jgi:integrase
VVRSGIPMRAHSTCLDGLEPLQPGTVSIFGRGLPTRAMACRTVVEVSIKNSPTGARMLTKPYPKDNEARTLALPADLVGQLTDWITTRHPAADDLLFATRDCTPISRNTFRTPVWLPAIKASGVDFDVRVDDLRHAHAFWLLAGGFDLKSVMDRMGHARSPPLRNTSTPSPTPTPRTSTP